MGDSVEDPFAPGGYRQQVDDKKLKLSDIWEENGNVRAKVLKEGRVVPLLYSYDFGVSAFESSRTTCCSYLLLQDCWTHKVEFISSGLSPNKSLKVIEANGYGPLEDSGGVEGWEAVKRAFAQPRPTTEQKELRNWAMQSSTLGSAFNPAATPAVTSLNKTGEFEKIARLCREGEGNGDDEER